MTPAASSEIIEGATLLVAVGVLFSVSYWLISRVEAAKWQQFIREKVATALEHGGGKTLAFVAFLAVYREGAETALFYQALFDEGPRVALPISLGIVLGFVALAVIFAVVGHLSPRKGHAVFLEAAARIAGAVGALQLKPFGRLPDAPVWITAGEQTFVATILADGTWFVSLARVEACDPPHLKGTPPTGPGPRG